MAAQTLERAPPPPRVLKYLRYLVPMYRFPPRRNILVAGTFCRARSKSFYWNDFNGTARTKERGSIPGWVLDRGAASRGGVAPREKPFSKRINMCHRVERPFFDRISMWTLVVVVMMVVLKTRFRSFCSYR